MKTWTMPKVEIDVFAGNECVSACKYSPVYPIDKNLNYGMDFVDGSENLDFEGEADGWYKKSGYEMIQAGQLPNAFTNAAFNQSGYWFRSKALYRKTSKSVPSAGVEFSNEDYFVYVGTYDVYVSPKGVSFWFYAPGTADGGTPSEDKNFS